MSEGAVRKIQPFTIGTRLSVPSEHKCPDFPDVYLPRDEIRHCENERGAPSACQSQGGPVTSEPAFVADRVHRWEAPDETGEEDRNSLSPPVCSRSIRKIAICSAAETSPASPCACGASNIEPKVNRNNSNGSDSNQASTEVDLKKKSDHQSKVDTWLKRNLKYGCSVLGPPSQDPEDPSPTQQRDLKDIENSLIQLTRSLDEEKKFRPIYVDADHSRDKQEKIGQTQRKKIPFREKNITQTWLRLQTLLRNYHQDLKLALDVSSFYQQADNIICAIHMKRSQLSRLKDLQSCGHTELKDIESQIMMLDETVLRLSDLHPTLATRVTRKQGEVQESWGLLLEEHRSRSPERSTTNTTDLSSNDIGSSGSSQIRQVQGSEEHEAHRIMGKNIKEEQNRMKEFQVMQVFETHKKSKGGENEGSPDKNCSQVTCDYSGNTGGQTEEPSCERERREQTCFELGLLLQDSRTSTDKTLLWLKDNIAVEAPHQQTSSLDCPETRYNQMAKMNSVDKRPECEQSKREQSCAFYTPNQSNVNMKDRLRQVEKLWEVLCRGSMTDTESIEVHSLQMAKIQETGKGQPRPSLSGSTDPMDDVKPCTVPGVKNLPATLDDCEMGMMTELQRCLKQMKLNPNDSQILTRPYDGECVGNPMEELLGVLEDLGEDVDRGGHSLHQSKRPTMRRRIDRLLSRCAELSMDVLDAETDLALRCEPDDSGLEGLQEQQDELEMSYQMIREEAMEMDSLASQPQVFRRENEALTWEDAQTTLQALEELGRSVAENQSRLQQFGELREFLRAYLAIISWTDKTCTCIFSEASAYQSKLHDSTEASELDFRIQQKFEDFDVFAAAGQKLIAEGHHLANIISERTDELQSMLGWMLVHWRTKKDQLNQEKPEDTTGKTSLAGTMVALTCQPQYPQPGTETSEPPKDLLFKRNKKTSEIRLEGLKVPVEDSQPGQSDHGSTYVSHQGPRDVALPPSLVLEDPRPAITPLGGSIDLILSFDQRTAVASQSESNQEQKEPLETVHRVSTYLQVSDGTKATNLMTKEVTSQPPAETNALSASPQTSSTTTTYIPKVSTVALPSISETCANSIPSLKGAMKRKKKPTHRHTVTGIVGMDRLEEELTATDGATNRSNTWPLEEKPDGQSTPQRPVNTELQLYIKNNSVVTIADANSSQTSSFTLPQAHFVKAFKSTNGQDKRHYSIPLGSMLSFDLAKNWEHVSEKSSINNGASEASKVFVPTFSPGPQEETEEENLKKVSPESVSILSLPHLGKDLHYDQNKGGRRAENLVTLQNIPSDSAGFKDDAEEDLCEPRVTLESHERSTEPNCCTTIISHGHTRTEPLPDPHKCLSVHTKICDLNGHIYRQSAKKRFTGQSNLTDQEVTGLSTGAEGSASWSVNRFERLIVCAEENCCVCSGDPTSEMILGKETSPNCSARTASDPVHPDRGQFEEEEKELEDIWSGTNRGRTPYSALRI